MNDDELAAIGALAEAATDGPWYVVGLPWMDDGLPYVNAGSPDPHHDGFVCDMENMATPDAPPNAQADAEFIAASRTAVPALVAALAEAHRDANRVLAEERDNHRLTMDRLAEAHRTLADVEALAELLHEHGTAKVERDWVSARIHTILTASRSGAESAGKQR